MNDTRKRIEEIETAMRACKPGVDFQQWQQLNDEKSRLEHALYVERITATTETHDFYAGIHKAIRKQ